ncbi:hypothetical protein GGTG_07263 [Gaeumannomyces tritici R3-111a-1]|uniref:Uncharacterized protein n=1 Tax=Gaeumannomyces tritici (strain R3-111a-1) TaxID=644352 RepID=J3P166_GAET3|nr:hypothetical protein GGTG_07263 [Gaeumannomyces tritici R3-111a-1]EJT77351.1 hypothetical protein GGTG_07263 [Gaeumannomyces tritici R3-111a-1]
MRIRVDTRGSWHAPVRKGGILIPTTVSCRRTPLPFPLIGTSATTLTARDPSTHHTLYMSCMSTIGKGSAIAARYVQKPHRATVVRRRDALNGKRAVLSLPTTSCAKTCTLCDIGSKPLVTADHEMWKSGWVHGYSGGRPIPSLDEQDRTPWPPPGYRQLYARIGHLVPPSATATTLACCRSSDTKPHRRPPPGRWLGRASDSIGY